MDLTPFAEEIARLGSTVFYFGWHTNNGFSADSAADLSCIGGFVSARAAEYGSDSDTVVIIGHSMGGEVGSKLALSSFGLTPGSDCVETGEGPTAVAFLGIGGTYGLIAQPLDDDLNTFAVRATTRSFIREIAADEPTVLYASAQFAIENTDFDQARTYLERTKEKFPEDLRTYRLLASLATQQNNIDEALNHIAEGLKIDEGNIELLWMRANIQMQAQDYEAVKKSIDELRDLKVSKTFIEFLEGLWALNQGHWIEAKNKLQKVRPEVSRVQQNLLIALDKGLARCHTQLGQHDLTAKDFSRILELTPDDIGAALGEIDALLKSGRKQLALKRFDTLDRKLGAPEDHPELLITRLRLEIERQKLKDEADRLWSYAKKLGKVIVDSEEIDQSRKESAVALLLRSMGKDDAARKIQDRRRSRDPENIAWKLEEAQKLSNENPQAASKVLDEIMEKHGDVPAVRLMRA